MRQQPVIFETHYSPESHELAGVAFRDYIFKRYGLLFIAACVVNAFALFFIFLSGAELGSGFLVVALLVVLGPIWLLYKYFAGPRLQSLMLGKALADRGAVRVDEDFVSLPGRTGKEVLLPWFKTRVVEHASLFLLVSSPFFAFHVPKQGMPVSAQQAFQAKSSRGVA